jgi:major membrane immunogen (membrane-anchored lipoprotein)
MRKLALISIVTVILSIFAACTGNIEIADGIYRAEYSDYDVKGYKDFIEITFEGGAVSGVVADGVSGLDGSLKSTSEEFRDEMETIAGTYPEKYYTDLINQYLENPDSSSIDIVAGATESSQSFIVLLRSLEKAIRTGSTETVTRTVPGPDGQGEIQQEIQLVVVDRA